MQNYSNPGKIRHNPNHILCKSRDMPIYICDLTTKHRNKTRYLCTQKEEYESSFSINFSYMYGNFK